MKARTLAALVLGGSCLIVGCGGASVSNLATGNPYGSSTANNPYAGVYGGVVAGDSSYPFTMTIRSDGSVTGVTGSSKGSRSFKGWVRDSGVGYINLGQSALSLTLGQPRQSTLAAVITDIAGYPQIAATISNPSGEFGGPNPFTGAYAGVITTLQGEGHPVLDFPISIPVAFNIDVNGNVSGVMMGHSWDVSSTPSAVAGTIDAEGNLSFEEAGDSPWHFSLSLASQTISGLTTPLVLGQFASLTMTQVPKS